MKRNWKAIQPTSFVDAVRLCKDFAREHHNRSVERIADLMGVTHHDVYKWLANGRLPGNLIPAFEHHCGCHFISSWLTLSAGKLPVDIPSGRNASATDANKLQAVLVEAVSQILQFAEGSTDADTALAAIHTGMAGLAWHKVNIEKHAQPEFQFGDEA